MFLLKATREQLISLLPAGGVGLEIGVAEGGFSSALLTQARPGRLHLVDPWEHQDDPAYRTDISNVSKEEADNRYRAVTERFSREIAAGQVVIHRGYSSNLAPSFADGSLDWVYIDGAHHFEACSGDLRLYAPKVRPGGLMLGHDYAASPVARQMNFGVVEAVNRFVSEGEAELLVLTYEQFPTYVLSRRPVPAEAQAFVGAALASFDVAAEIRRPETKRFEQYIATIHYGGSEPAERLILAFD